jgi:hypothetical protein
MAERTILLHGTTSTRWAAIRKEGVLRIAPQGDRCVSLTDDHRVARYFADNACAGDVAMGRRGARPVVLAVDVTGLDARPHSSAVWGEGECDWERETACWEDVPIERVSLVPPARTVRYDGDVHRIQRDGEAVLAFAMRLSNGLWSLADVNDRRIGRASYRTPKEVARAFDALRPEGRH